jgi:hypothetical protein
MVHGDATLVGNVNLTCNLEVMGPAAILRARAGVTVTGNGFEIMFMDGARADIQGTVTSTWSNDGLTQNRVRSINFNGISRMMFHQGAGVSTLRYFKITGAGRMGVVGFYPLHFHLNGNTTRGTLVEGVVIENSQNRAFVPHGSHGITFRDTIAFNIRGPAYWWDPGFAPNASNDILFDHALADTIIGESPSDRGYRLSAFTLRDGTNLTVRNSVARNVNPLSDKDCSGFQWPEDAESAWTFTNNASFSTNCGNGIFVWQNEGPVHLVTGFRTNGAINHGAYNNKYDYRNVTATAFEAHAIGWKMSDSSVGAVTFFEHAVPNPAGVVWVNVNVTSLHMFDSPDREGNDHPTLLTVTGGNLTCSMIDWSGAHPSSRVVINGVACVR